MAEFVTSDTHFFHANIIKYSNRPWSSMEEMNEGLIERWNEKVKPGDIVYHLGDFSFGNPHKMLEEGRKLKRRLNGTVFLIKGNHESLAMAMREEFAWVKDVAEVYIGEKKIFLSHYAHRVWNKSHHGVWHLYGHSHGSLPDDPNSMSFDVGVDCHNYYPLDFDDIRTLMSKKTWKPIDHHGEGR